VLTTWPRCSVIMCRYPKLQTSEWWRINLTNQILYTTSFTIHNQQIQQLKQNDDNWQIAKAIIYIVTYSGSIHDGTLLHSKSQYTTIKHSQQLFEHTYTSDPHGLGTLTPIEFFQQDLLWQSSITPFHSYSQKASKHKSGQSIIRLSILLHTTTALRRVFHH
jgi:hypothetical protein